jgi:SAM-dependent methyltransferase
MTDAAPPPSDPALPPAPPAPWRNPWEGSLEERRLFRATFDEDPDAYDRSRPVSPPQVFDDAVAIASLGPGSRVLEIGPGTGQATRPLAERGLLVTALELGPSLADRARRNLADLPGVAVYTTSFEDWDPAGQTFDAVFCCNAFHWLDHDVRFARPATLLRPGGHLIVLATPWVRPDGGDRFWWDNQDDWAAVGEARLGLADSDPDRITDISGPLAASGIFAEPVRRRYRFDLDFTAEDYLANLATQSGFKRLSPAMQQELAARLRRRIEARGGGVRAHYLATLVIAGLR